MIIIEVWRPVRYYEGFYEVSNIGRVRSLDRISCTKSGVFKRTKGRILNLTVKNNGYLTVMLCVESRQKRFHVHRLVCDSFNENILNLPMVNHKDSDRKNNIPENLEWCDQKGNMSHAMQNNRMPKGENTHGSKLTENKILAIRRLYKINPSFNKLKTAEKLGIRDSTIHKIIKKQRWKHI